MAKATTAGSRRTARTEPEPRNEVVLAGRLSGVTEVTLPSGDEVVSFRVVVDRTDRAARTKVDAVECSAWLASPRKRVLATSEGDWIEVTGELRRRFWRGDAGARSRVEVEVRTVRRIP